MSRENDPRRLSEAAPESPLGRLFASAERDVPTDQELAKLEARLGSVLEPMPLPPVAARGSSLLVKVAATVGVAALMVAGVWVLKRPRAGSAASAPALSTPLPAIAPPGPSAAPDPSAAPAAPSAAPEPVLSAAPAATLLPKKASSEPLKQAASGGPSEPALLEQARRALSASPATALALAGQHAARFPHGVLAQEREVIAIEALRRLGRNAEADRRAAAFARAFPGSAHQRMVEDAAPK